jgi:hypothetical protein
VRASGTIKLTMVNASLLAYLIFSTESYTSSKGGPCNVVLKINNLAHRAYSTFFDFDVIRTMHNICRDCDSNFRHLISPYLKCVNFSHYTTLKKKVQYIFHL